LIYVSVSEFNLATEQFVFLPSSVPEISRSFKDADFYREGGEYSHVLHNDVSINDGSHI